jgi:hypothetical protein
MSTLPAFEDWNAAVIHSRENPAHILGPYDDDDGQMQMDCNDCDFDTGAVPAAAPGAGAGTADGGTT